MRCIDCPCGHPFKGGDDEEPFRLIREGIVADAYAVGAVT
jgi:hypothetical protein